MYKFRLSAKSHIECSRFFNVLANTAAALFKVCLWIGGLRSLDIDLAEGDESDEKIVVG